MILIGQEIIDALKAHKFTITGVSVSDAYSVSTPKCPQLTLDELPGNSGVYLDGYPAVVRNILTLEAYTKDMMISGSPRKKRDAAFMLIMEADTFLNETFGLTMSGNIQAVPYSDSTIFRAAANYVAYIDTRTNEILRGLNNGISY
ncbi:MAG TPA: hypothetical protein VHO94_04065 [Oscillospiraceae bacterium]|nr:hypothetical protein [Oscillospiraceae bacterium]